MMSNQKCEISILGVQFWIFITVSVNSNDTICVFCDHLTVRVHTKSTTHASSTRAAIHNLAFIHLICNRLPDVSRTFKSNTNINSIIAISNSQLLTQLRCPLRATSTSCNNYIFSFEPILFAFHSPFLTNHFNVFDCVVVININLTFKILHNILNDKVILFSTQMSDICIENMKIVL